MNRKTIDYVIPEMSTKGGIQEYARSISTSLKGNYSIRDYDYFYDIPHLISLSMRLLPVKVAQNLMTTYIARQFRNRFDYLKGDLIHFWHIDPAIFFLDRKYIVTTYGMELLLQNLSPTRRLLYKRAFENAKKVIAISEYTKSLLINNYAVNNKKIQIIRPPVDVQKLSAHIKKKAKRVIIGTLSRLVKRKNIFNIVAALNLLQARTDIAFEYHLAGDGELRDGILQVLKQTKFKWRYFGKISEEEKIKSFYPGLDVFVMPTLELPNSIEGFGIVYLEANCYGIPVLASRTGGVIDAVKEGVSGEFADPQNPESICKQLHTLCKNKDKYYTSAKQWASKFDIKVAAQQYDKVYQELLQQPVH